MLSMFRYSIQSILAAWLIACSWVNAQIGVQLNSAQNQYLNGESVIIDVLLTNHTGADLTLQNSNGLSWLEFVVRRANDDVVTPLRGNLFQSVKITTGQTVVKKINLSQLFHFKEAGNYRVSCVVRMTGDVSTGFTSNRLTFSVSNARADWSQKVGVPGQLGVAREYRLTNFTNSSKTQLYAQIIDDRTATPIQTLCFGEALLFRKPQAAVDRQQNLHVLYLANPQFYVHTQININGQLLNRELHQRGAGGDPQLMTFADGSVKVMNSILFDAKAAEAARRKIRKLTDRPSYTYQ